MIHPFQPDLKPLSDQELENKIQELSRRYFQAMRLSPSIKSDCVTIR